MAEMRISDNANETRSERDVAQETVRRGRTSDTSERLILHCPGQVGPGALQGRVEVCPVAEMKIYCGFTRRAGYGWRDCLARQDRRLRDLCCMSRVWSGLLLHGGGSGCVQ